ELAPGAEAAVMAALGEAVQAVVVDGGEAAAHAVELLRAGDASGLLLVVDGPGGSVGPLPPLPPGVRPVTGCVRARVPSLQRMLARLLGGTVLVEAGWRTAVELVLAHPLVAVTSAGDRLGGTTPWRIGGAARAAVTRAAFEDAVSAATAADAARVGAEAAVARARVALDGARAAAVGRATLEHRRVMLNERLGAVEARLAARDPDAQTRAERRRAALLDRAAAHLELGARLADHLARTGGLHDRLRERRRRQAEAARASTEQLDTL